MESVAHINRLFGSNGEVMITLYESFVLPHDPSSPLFIKVDGLFVPLYLNKFERRGRAGAIVGFDDLESDERMLEFLDQDLYAPLDDDYSVDDDEFTLDDLIGYKVCLHYEEQVIEGEISDFIDGENPLFEIAIEEDTHLIPAVEEFILAIDFENQTMKLAPPSGLLEL